MIPRVLDIISLEDFRSDTLVSVEIAGQHNVSGKNKSIYLCVYSEAPERVIYRVKGVEDGLPFATNHQNYLVQLVNTTGCRKGSVKWTVH